MMNVCFVCFDMGPKSVNRQSKPALPSAPCGTSMKHESGDRPLTGDVSLGRGRGYAYSTSFRRYSHIASKLFM